MTTTLLHELMRIAQVLILGPLAYFALTYLAWLLVEPRSRSHRRRVFRKFRNFKKWRRDLGAWDRIGEDDGYGSVPRGERFRVRR